VDILTDTLGTKRTLTALYSALANKGVDVDKVIGNIKTTCSRILQGFSPMIEHQVKLLNGNQPVPGLPFQILGFDLMID
jgi:hypothetical protein